ncbi:carbohydrate ABC transporter permease [Mesorhizobium sp. YM1C-6-2]|uniref:carbohydrate ABC transporter permease n=1 Tax=Mesorhizobium sp. YM1C-6-2 TaxID=1827501 RepID=UPI000EF1BE37|nr:carbohydrate ABC transporter permease [Mesorhizobium sp. YM1C-6-2]RLP27018.1 carbohydrate ABC transporter permease [Mesorhizobium sp. YM1C-6-2]
MIFRRRRKAIFRASAIYLAAAVVLLVMAFPLYALVLTSVQPENLMRSRDLQVIPSQIIFDHYQAVLAPGHIVPLRQGMLNSLLVSLCTAAFCVLLALPAAYALARLRVPGSKAILGVLVSVYFLPTTLFLIPMFVVFVGWGLDDTILSLVLTYSGFILPFQIWILKTFIDRLPVELEEAARIDGCTPGQIVRLIVLPLIRPGILAGFVFAFILSWIEFLTPLIFTNSLKISTVALGMFRSTIDIQIGQQAAAAVLTLLPVALVMIVFQRLVTQVMLAGADK